MFRRDVGLAAKMGREMSVMGAPTKDAPLAPGEDDGHNFRHAMREFAAGVAIVACRDGGALNGCTATAVTSLSLTPPSLLVCLNRNSSTLAGIRRSGSFCVNILTARQQGLAERFAGRGGEHGADRFAEGDWLSLATDAPALSDACAAIDCRVDEIIEKHTHAILIGLVAAVRLDGAASALLHWRSRFEALA